MKSKPTAKQLKTSKSRLKEANDIEGTYQKMLVNDSKWIGELNAAIEKHFDVKKKNQCAMPLKSISAVGSQLCQSEKFWILFIKRMMSIKEMNCLNRVIDAFTYAFSIVDEECISLMKTFYLKTIKQYAYAELIHFHKDKLKKSKKENADISNLKGHSIRHEVVRPHEPIPNSFCFELIGINFTERQAKRSKLRKTNENSLSIIPELKKSQRLKTPPVNVEVNRALSLLKDEENCKHIAPCVVNNSSQGVVSQRTIELQETFMNNIEKAIKEEQEVVYVASQSIQEDHQLSLTQTIEKLLDNSH